MNLRETILKEHSKTNCDLIVSWVGNNPQRFDELVKLVLNDEYRIVQRAAWPLSEVVKSHPLLIKMHLQKIISLIQKPGLHEAVKRNVIRLFQFIDIPKKFHGEIMSLCFDYLISPTQKPAVKAYSLTILDNLAKQYPEIKQELKTTIEDRWQFETAAFHSRAKKILNQQ